MALDPDNTNSRVSCPVCGKIKSKNFLLTHIKTQHSNAYKTEFWDKYSVRYKQTLADNKKLFTNSKE